MKNCTLLDVRRSANADRTNIAAQYTPVPDASIPTDLDVANHHHVFGKKHCRVNTWNGVLK